MDAKKNSSEALLQQKALQAKALIETWRPDLIYTNDDTVQQYIVKDYINTDIPFVFSGVNANPDHFGFTGSTNITGVLEQEHFVETVKLLKAIVPDVKRIEVIVDKNPMWDPVIRRMEKSKHLLPDIAQVNWTVIDTFDAFKRKIIQCQTSADALGLFGIFQFKDGNGRNVPYQQVLKWVTENSGLPDFSFWKDRITYGTLCMVTVSGFEQGLAAGRIARGILSEGRRPSDFPIKPTVKGAPVVSLARAKLLGINLDSDILLTAEIIERLAWEK